MSGGSQHNPNGRQSQIGSGWSPLQLQMASYLARAPAAHLSSERGAAHAHAHAWHTPTPPHLYHAPADPPDPLQAMKATAAGNSVFRHTATPPDLYRHTATPPDLYRHTPTPPDKHSLLRHTPSPGDVKAAREAAELYPHLGAARDKLPRPEDMLAYSRGVDLSLSRAPGAANGGPLSLSVRDAPTINSLIARAAPRALPHARLDSLLERLAPSPPVHAHHAQTQPPAHSVIVHGRAGPTPSPPSSEDSTDSGAGGKRKRKPATTARLPPAPPAPPAAPALPAAAPAPPAAAPAPPPAHATNPEAAVSRLEPPKEPKAHPPPPAPVLENGESHAHNNGPAQPERRDPPAAPHTRRKTRAGSAETIADIAAMIASTDKPDRDEPPDVEPDTPVTIDKLESVLASPDKTEAATKPASPDTVGEPALAVETPLVETAAAPKRRRTRTDLDESCNVPVQSPSEARPAEPDANGGRSVTEPGKSEMEQEAEVSSAVEQQAGVSSAVEQEAGVSSAAPAPASIIVDVENQLEMMFAGIEEPQEERSEVARKETGRRPKASRGKKRRKSAAASKPEKVTSRGAVRGAGAGGAGAAARRECDSGSNASSQGKARGPYIQIRGPRESPTSVSVVNSAVCGGEEGAAGAAAAAEGGAGAGAGAGGGWRRGHARGLHASTLGLRYDATTADSTWVCVFCERGPHSGATVRGAAPHPPLGDLFGPYSVSTECAEFRALDADTRRRHPAAEAEVWLHADCGLWAPGLTACGARVWGLRQAVWTCRGAACAECGARGAGLACARRGCPATAHLPCAAAAGWRLDEARLRAHCAAHAPV